MEFINLLTTNTKLVIAIIVWIVLWLLVWLVIWRTLRHFEIRRNKLDAIKRSKASILWELYEKVLPFMPDFDYSPKDMVFVWKWFDYLILDWLNEWDLREIIFLEVKSWSSQLNQNEKKIRQAVGSKKVRYLEYKIKN